MSSSPTVSTTSPPRFDLNYLGNTVVTGGTRNTVGHRPLWMQTTVGVWHSYRIWPSRTSRKHRVKSFIITKCSNCPPVLIRWVTSDGSWWPAVSFPGFWSTSLCGRVSARPVESSISPPPFRLF
uniref:Uncharacterized protein n=1 Tax=Cacopsylla melanoneura TaxID=428564 RepID=A0A8D8R4I9_9HEMI